MTEQTEIRTSPERYIRIGITKNSKGYTYETTVSQRWTGIGLDDAMDELAYLNRCADTLARQEISEREQADAE